ncbi:2-succinyl-5-enolpyruvyl-6-hydroxy-3-cyclohexene-1-carboxylic-acid synthase [Afifella sp. IM 167]|uniref:2-succinyl-5-enolpyruvyl-6-hydroxy-3- cyclohexene-1-carboxylic-acid synthase n=1 Tax=Afifella sp. IM 167 TaxID=2033586 RepID=UPI001CC97629|nr:2-succinyl-5-enolpyruvyl-6-hydroxy-3-cyclohexene-1-carboxylic-acid synthase [Afifella sp. IM 167]
MSAQAEVNFAWAEALLGALAAAGLRQVVASPGSRSTPLTLAAFRNPDLELRMVLDERSAGFFALGMAKASGVPVALVATSGSAIANWMPAVVEADMARVPLLLLSADRPPELQNRGANQTMEQAGLFGGHVRSFVQLPPAEEETAWFAPLAARLVEASLRPLAGPVHVNVPFREPLVPGREMRADTALHSGPLRLSSQKIPQPESVEAIARILREGRGAIVCGSEALGEEARAAICDLARRLDAPVHADILSGLRSGHDEHRILAHPDQVVRVAPVPDWILRFGGTPVSKALLTLFEAARGRPQIVVSASPRLSDPAGTASHVVEADAAALCSGLNVTPGPAEWIKEILSLDALAAETAETVSADPEPFEGSVVLTLMRALPAETPVFLGNSLAVRAADWFGGRGAVPLRLFGSRGVSGIDGNVSTAFGIAAVEGPAVAVVGDLAFQHDLGALALGRDLPLAILVLDNGGGGIFDHLAQAGLPEFTAGWLTPQALDPVAAARAFGLHAETADTTPAAVAAVIAALARPGASVIRVPIDRRASLARFRRFFSALPKERQT